jgi:hypothetical protein
MFPTTHRMAQALGFRDGYTNPLFICTDAALSKLMSWNLHYHRDTFFKKLAPWACYWITRKR